MYFNALKMFETKWVLENQLTEVLGKIIILIGYDAVMSLTIMHSPE